MRHFGDYIWNFISKFGGQVLWLGTTMLLARLLTPDDFGVVGVLSIIFVVANTLTESGLGGALIIQKQLIKEDCDTIFTFNFVVSLTLYVVVFFFSNSIERFYDIDKLSFITRVLGCVFIINGFTVVPRTILCHQLRFKEICVITLVTSFISSIVAVLMAYLGMGVYSLVAYQLLSALLLCIGYICKSKYTIELRFHLTNFKKLISFGIFTTLAGVVDTIYQNVLSVILGKFMNTAQVGLFSQAKKIEEASSQSIIGTVNSTSFPILSKLSSNLNAFINEADSLLKNVPLLLFPLLILIGVYSKEIVLILFGREWIGASGYLALLMISAIFVIFDTLIINFIKSLGQVGNLLILTITKRTIGLIVIIISALISINYIVYAYVFSGFLGCMMSCWLYCKGQKRGYLQTYLLLFKALVYLFVVCMPIYLSHTYCSLYMSILATVIILCGYYFFFLPIVGINMLKIVTTLINRRK